MKKILLVLAVLQLCTWGMVKAQTPQDSITLVSTSWKNETVRKGVVHRYADFQDLYKGPQSIHIVEISPDAGLKLAFTKSDKMEKTSRMASENQGIAAINGSYYNMKKGNSTCFLKIGREVVDTTTTDELKARVTGAAQLRKGKLKLIPWNKQIEQEYKGKKKEVVLASGPLMLKDGSIHDWSDCDTKFIQTKHPRSAIAITGDKKILLITADGRSADHAIGVNIPELAHLIRIIGGKEALNLDGGGSTTLWIAGATDNGVVNHPSDNKKFDHGGERSVANILYVYK